MKKATLYIILLLASHASYSQVFDNETKSEVDRWSQREKTTRARIRENKIHSLKTYAYKSDTATGSGFLSSEINYDDNGNMLEYKVFRKSGALKYHYSYSWDADGRNLEFRQIRSDGSNKYRETNIYDASGNKTESRTYGRTWLLNSREKLWWHSIATFDDAQNMLEQKFFMDKADKKLFDRYVYAYYSDGSKKQTIEYSGKGKVRHTWNYDCDPAGAAEVKNFKDSSKICVRYETDKDGNKIKVTDENVKYGKVVRIVHRYDKNENLLEEISYDSKQRPRFHSVSAYDDKNNCTGFTVYERNSSKIKNRSEYRYDSSGNIAEVVAYKNSSVPERILKYNYAR